VQPRLYGTRPGNPWGPSTAETVTGFAGILGIAALIGIAIDAIVRRRFRDREVFLALSATGVFALLASFRPAVAALQAFTGLAAHARLRFLFAWLLAVLIAAPILKGLAAPEPPLMVHEGRYLFHLLAIFVVVAVIGVLELRRFVRPGWIIPLFMVAVIARLGLALFDGAADYAAKVKNINDLQIATARWLQKTTTPEARIATNDIGAIAYFSGRFIIDTEGLITPEAIHPKRMRRLVPFLESQRPDLLIIFPEWYPEIVARTDLFHEVYRIHAKQEAAGAPDLVMFRMPWTRASVVPGLVQ